MVFLLESRTECGSDHGDDAAVDQELSTGELFVLDRHGRAPSVK
jgi:hypothetical protein